MTVRSSAPAGIGDRPAGEEPSMSTRTTTVLVVLRDDAQALVRLLALCHRRGWTPAALRSDSDGTRCEVTMRLRVPADRRGTDAQVRAQLARLVGAEVIAVSPARRRAPRRGRRRAGTRAR